MQKTKLIYSLICTLLFIPGCNRHDASKPSLPENQQPPPISDSPAPEPEAQPQPEAEAGRFARPKTLTTPVQTEPSTQAEKQPTSLPTAEQAKLNERIKQTLGANCRFERACDQLIGVDCNSAVDGPYYYVEPDTLKVVAKCGGYCMSGACENCPPAAWTCTTY